MAPRATWSPRAPARGSEAELGESGTRMDTDGVTRERRGEAKAERLRERLRERREEWR